MKSSNLIVKESTLTKVFFFLIFRSKITQENCHISLWRRPVKALMPWVEMIVAVMTEMKSSNWIAQETRSQAANGKKLEICNLRDTTTCQFLFQNLMISAIEQQNYFNFILNNK